MWSILWNDSAVECILRLSGVYVQPIKLSSLLVVWPSVLLSWAGNPQLKWHLAGIHWQQMRRRFRCVHEKEILNHYNPVWVRLTAPPLLLFPALISPLVVSRSHSVIWQLAEELGALNEGVTIQLLFLHSNALAHSYIKHTYMCIEAIKHAKHIHTIQTDWGCGSKEVNTGGVSEMICKLVCFLHVNILWEGESNCVGVFLFSCLFCMELSLQNK